MAESLGKLRDLTDMINFLKSQRTLLREGSKMWRELYEREAYYLKSGNHQLLDWVTSIKTDMLNLDDFFGGSSSGSEGPISQLIATRYQYPIRLKPGELFDSWNLINSCPSIYKDYIFN